MQGRRNNKVPVLIAWGGSNQRPAVLFPLGETANSDGQRGRKCSSCDGGASSIMFSAQGTVKLDDSAGTVSSGAGAAPCKPGSGASLLERSLDAPLGDIWRASK
jgi:hypothetical protein